MTRRMVTDVCRATLRSLLGTPTTRHELRRPHRTEASDGCRNPGPDRPVILDEIFEVC
jgi:hypothetical protein